jgi:hypothetical protein
MGTVPVPKDDGKNTISQNNKRLGVTLGGEIPKGHAAPPLPRGPKPASLGAIIAQFKSRATKRIWKTPEFKATSIWQRNYYEHIIRNEKDLQNKTDYIESNPLLWDEVTRTRSARGRENTV